MIPIGGNGSFNGGEQMPNYNWQYKGTEVLGGVQRMYRFDCSNTGAILYQPTMQQPGDVFDNPAAQEVGGAPHIVIGTPGHLDEVNAIRAAHGLAPLGAAEPVSPTGAAPEPDVPEAPAAAEPEDTPSSEEGTPPDERQTA